MTDNAWLQLIRDRRQPAPVTPADDADPRLPQLDGIRAVIFDVYGTLFSSGVGDISLATEENRDQAMRSVLTGNNIGISPAGDDLRFDEVLHATIRRHQDRRRAEGIAHPEVEIRAVWADLIEELSNAGQINPRGPIDTDTLVIDYETRVNAIQPMPELAIVLTELHSRGLPMSIISNAQFYTPLLFEAFLKKDLAALGFCTKCSVWSYRELEGKPSPALYRIAAERLQRHHGLSPEECLYVGNDMRNDIWPAQALGYHTALFAGDHLSLRRRRDHPEAGERQADAEITRLGQILELI